jgi:hypothetical protein
MFLAIAVFELAAHWPLLRLLYFWDEAGYYIPAARDLLLTGSLIPLSTLSNAHPPLVLGYLALAWKIFGYSPLVTRTAMLLIASFGLVGVFRLAAAVSTGGVAFAATTLVAIYPVFFAQSSLAQLDLAAAALTTWGLLFVVRNKFVIATIWFLLAALAKETAIIAPLAVLVWKLVEPKFCYSEGSSAKSESRPSGLAQNARPQIRNSIFLLFLPIIPLAAWFSYHYLRTGYIFGNPQFFHYNVSATLTPARVGFALIGRLWQLLGHMNLFALTVPTAIAMFMKPIFDDDAQRQRIAIPVQLLFAIVIATYWIALSLIGGALLARYMLPVIPMVIIVCVSTLRRRIAGWPVLIVLIAGIFVAALFINPPYVFAPEDNLAYVDFVRLQQRAAEYLAPHSTSARVLTAWPASDELAKPYLGYVQSPIRVLQIENFTRENLEAAAQSNGFNYALTFSTKYEPAGRLPTPAFWRRAQEHYFGYHQDASPAEAAQILGGELKFVEHRGGQWVAIIAMPEFREATLVKNPYP